MAPNLDICGVTRLPVVFETAFSVGNPCSNAGNRKLPPEVSAHRMAASRENLERSHPGSLNGPEQLHQMSGPSALLILFRRLGSRDRVFGHLNLHLIGDFQDKCLFFHAGNDAVNPGMRNHFVPVFQSSDKFPKLFSPLFLRSKKDKVKDSPKYQEQQQHLGKLIGARSL